MLVPEDVLVPQELSCTPEWRLLIVCCNPDESETRQRALLSKLTHHINWKLFEWLSTIHQVRPLVYSNLIDHADLIPGEQFQRFQLFYQAHLLQYHVKSRQLYDLLTLFENAGLAVIPYKGLSLAQKAYKNPAQREFVDIDLFCRKDAIHPLIALLEKNDYKIKHGVPPREEVNQAQLSLFLETECEYTLWNTTKGISVEPHWDFAPRKFCTSLVEANLWDGLESFSLQGMTVPCFSNEDLLIVLCVNGNKDYWKSFKILCDIAGLIKNSTDLDWDLILDTARRLGILRIVCLGLSLSDTFHNYGLPTQVQDVLDADPLTLKLMQKMKKKLLLAQSIPVQENFSFQISWDLTIRERWRDRLRYLWVNICLPGPADAKVINLPPYLWAGYFVVRPIRLLWKFTGWLLAKAGLFHASEKVPGVEASDFSTSTRCLSPPSK